MNLFEAIYMGLIAGLTPSPHSLYLSYVSLREDDEKKRSVPAVISGGLIADAIIITAVGLTINAMGIAQTMGPYFSALTFGFILLMAYNLLIRKRHPSQKSPRLLTRSPLVNGLGVQLLNIYPYLFWGTVYFPSVNESSMSMAVLVAAVFLVTTYSIKWLAYGRLINAISTSLRVKVIRLAFFAFTLSYVWKQIEVL